MSAELFKIKNLPIKLIDGDRSSRYPKRDELLETGDFVFPSTSNIVDGRILTDDIKYVTDEKFNQIKKGRFVQDDIIITTRGTIGNLAFIKSSDIKGLVNAQMLIVRADGKVVHPEYLYYQFKSENFQKQLKNFASGSAQPQIPKRDLREVEILMPPIETQQKIASILSAFDDLIENNTRRIAILEETARLIYREWFVHYRYPGHENDRMVDSGTELGEVPEGWGVKKLNEFGRIETGKTPPKKDPDNYGDYMPFIKTPDMHDQLFIHDSNEFLSKKGTETQKNKTLPPNSLIVNCIGAGAGVVSITTKSSHTNQQINAIILDDLKVREFLYLSLVELRPMLRSIGSAGATMINVSKGKFQALEIVWPGVELIEKFYEKVAPMFDQIKILQKQNLKLKETRDLLLPKLISGKFDINNFTVN